MSKLQIMLQALNEYSPRQIEVSARGSGCNATWIININGKRRILKTYSSRRAPLQTLMTGMEHLATGRTGYSPCARYNTEKHNLRLWHDSGIDVPEVVEHKFPTQLKQKHICMTFIEGPLLSDYIFDKTVSSTDKDKAFIKFLGQWYKRHKIAEQTSNPFLIHEHATFDHIILAPDGKFFTFDLEVSFTGKKLIQELIGAEICNYMRSLLKKMSQNEIAHYTNLFATHYSEKHYTERYYQYIFKNRSLLIRLAHRIDINSRNKNDKLSKYDVAQILHTSLIKDSIRK